MDCCYECWCTAGAQLRYVSLFKAALAVMPAAAFRCGNVLRHVLLERYAYTHVLYLTCDAWCYSSYVCDGWRGACMHP